MHLKYTTVWTVFPNRWGMEKGLRSMERKQLNLAEVGERVRNRRGVAEPVSGTDSGNHGRQYRILKMRGKRTQGFVSEGISTSFAPAGDIGRISSVWKTLLKAESADCRMGDFPGFLKAKIKKQEQYFRRSDRSSKAAPVFCEKIQFVQNGQTAICRRVYAECLSSSNSSTE